MNESASYRAKVRMYRHGLGDCFLIALPRSGADRNVFWIMIDCGVILGTENADATMQSVVRDIAAVTGGHVDLLVATHEHWDHISGFIQAKEAMKAITFDAVWLGWTEDKTDSLAETLLNEKAGADQALRLSAARLRLGAATDAADEVDSLLGFLGAAAGSTSSALEVVRGLGPVRYCRPADAPVALPGTSVRAYILGPPHDEAAIKKVSVPASSPEVYGVAAREAFFTHVLPALEETPASPFDAMQTIPMDVGRTLPFFRSAYFEDAGTVETSTAWRRIDSSWLDDAPQLALQLDNATNNTSLVLALELDNGDTMLFPGDAQVGSWESWPSLTWSVDGRTVTGRDLLKRCIFYKVGHHGSHNATLREGGLELMERLGVAMIPVDHAMAVKKNWTRMPLPALVERLHGLAHGAVVQADQPKPDTSAVEAPSDLAYVVTVQ